MTAPQHATLSIDRWRAFALDRQILMIANEMYRGSKLQGPADRERLRNCYERVLALTDLTIACRDAPGLRRELLRWRDLVAALYVAQTPDAGEHRQALRCLLRMTPASAEQVALLT